MTWMADDWIQRGRPPQSHPITCTYSSRGGGIWENTSSTRKRGSYLSEKRARKAGGEQMRERHVYVVTNHCERGISCLSHQQQHRNKTVPQTFLANHGKSEFPQTLWSLNQNRVVFSKQQRHYYSLPNFPPDVLGPLYKNSMYLVCNKNTPKSLEPCAYNSHLCAFHM